MRAKCARALRHILLFVNPRIPAGLLALGLCAAASALSLGELKVRSPIGSPFEAVLPYTASADEVLSPQCIRGHEDAGSRNQHVPLLANVRFTITPSAGGGEIVIRTRTLVHEPAVRIRLTIDCGPKTLLVREYVVLLDAPPAMVEPVPAAVAVPLAAVPLPPTPSRVRCAAAPRHLRAMPARLVPRCVPCRRCGSRRRETGRPATPSELLQANRLWANLHPGIG